MTFIHFYFEKWRSATGFAGAAVFLASSDASFIAGTELFVDGGQAQI
jgi:NAD(P)-dependent dehydrogenase (short-subunit alcohol dehydrogenase family)